MKRYALFLAAALSFVLLVCLSSCYHRHRRDNFKVVSYKGKYICISFGNYIKALSSEISSGSKPTGDLDTLYGMSWIDGYVIDSKHQDIILVGEKRKGRPVYHSQDIFINYQNVFGNTPPPYCSLDPDPQNITRLNQFLALNTNDLDAKIKNCREAIGGQKVVVGGVPTNSRAAAIMIYADYDMKKISQGLLTAPGIQSTIQIALADSSRTGSPALSMSRFWLHIKEPENGVSYPNYNENDGIVFINECPVAVLTEKQYVDSKGNLADNHSEKDRDAIEFAAQMTAHYDSLVAHGPLFAELENMFRLQSCFRMMQFKDAVTSSGLNNASDLFGFQLTKGNDLPEALPGLINYKYQQHTNGYEFFIVAGGVSQEMKINEANLYRDRSGLLASAAKVIIAKRPDNASVYWYTDLDIGSK